MTVRQGGPRMKLRLFVEPQRGTTYQDLRRVARCAEDRGFDAFVCADHYANTAGPATAPGPVDAWTTLAALSVETSTIRIGTMMSPVTFRLPGQLAVISAQVDQMSGGRVELGLGTGWFAPEHEAYGIPFPPLATRFECLTEQLEILGEYWSTPVGETFSYLGKHYRLVDCPALPVACQPSGPRLIVGGTGQRRTPRLAARFADEFNVPFPDMAQASRQFDALDEACREVGRAAETITRSVVLSSCVGEDRDSVDRRVGALSGDAEHVRATGLVGTPDEVVDAIGRWRERCGVQSVYFHLADLSDLHQLDLIGSRIMPQLPAG
jgi:F420-dependent oxidoreductase-like protein